MEAFAFAGNIAVDPLAELAAATSRSVSLPPLVHKRQLVGTAGTPVKRRKVSEPVSSPGSPMSTSSVGSTTSSSKSGSRPNVTASSSITLDMLRPHFEEPLAKVAAHFGICVTLLKKICRRHGIARWPHRQITGLRKSIASMEHAIGYFDGDRRESYAEQLLKQKKKLAALLEDPTVNNPLLANEEEQRVENTRKQTKTSPVHEVAPALMTRASSPTGPVLAESPYYGASMIATPAQTPPMWLPAPHVEPNYTQNYHQVCPPTLDQRSPVYPSSYYMPGAIAISNNVPTTAIQLPPLRRESRAVLPPISSLVISNNIFSSMPTTSW
ncbi:RWP-RK domain [Phytophthora infestans]|nr:RWP-RK domain [Phytophthora infestans]KAF4140099.1 RWP-RK domain [Phytophthora infestans]